MDYIQSSDINKMPLALPPASSPAQPNSAGSTLFQRIASGDDVTLQKSFSFLQKYQMPSPTNRQHLARLLAETCIKFGDSACKDLAAIHPDADFIIENMAAPAVVAENVNSKKAEHHCDCGCNSSSHIKNDVGTILQPISNWAGNQSNRDVVIYVLAFITVAFVFHKLTQ